MKFRVGSPLLLTAVVVAWSILPGCAHHRGVEKQWEVATPVAETEVFAPNAPIRTEIALDDEDWSKTGVLAGHVRRRTDGTQKFVVEQRQLVRVVPYEFWEATLMRTMIAPMFLALLGPLYARSTPDYAGDGKVGFGDRARYALAFLNYFEAYPNGRASERQERTASTTRERRETELALPNISGEIEIELTADGQKETLRGTLDDGAFAFDLSGLVPRFFGTNPQATLLDRTSGVRLVVSSFDRFHVAEALWNGGRFQQGESPLGKEQREVAKKLFLWKANSNKTSPPRAVELFNRAYWLTHGDVAPAVADPPAGAEIIDLDQAVASGRVLVSGRGVDLYRISATLENLTPDTIHVRIPPGTLFDCEGTAQDMLTTEFARVDLPPMGVGHRRSVTIAAACANMSKATPGGKDSFRLIGVPDPRLTQIAPHLRPLAKNIRQAVVWILTDNATLRKFARYQRPHIGRSEVLQAIATFVRAGISIDDRAIWTWYSADR